MIKSPMDSIVSEESNAKGRIPKQRKHYSSSLVIEEKPFSEPSQTTTVKNNTVIHQHNRPENDTNQYKELDNLIENIISQDNNHTDIAITQNKQPDIEEGNALFTTNMNNNSNVQLKNTVSISDSLCKQQSTKYEGKNFDQYDLQSLAYDIVKEYSNFKADKNATFMKRMLFDVF